MDSTKKTILISLFMIVLYLILINLFIIYKESDSQSTQENQSVSSGLTTNIGLSGSVKVTIVGHRWYGKVVTNGDRKDIYLFDIIPIPERYKGNSFMVFHILFILIASEILILLNKKWRKNETLDKSHIDSSP